MRISVAEAAGNARRPATPAQQDVFDGDISTHGPLCRASSDDCMPAKTQYPKVDILSEEFSVAMASSCRSERIRTS